MTLTIYGDNDDDDAEHDDDHNENDDGMNDDAGEFTIHVGWWINEPTFHGSKRGRRPTWKKSGQIAFYEQLWRIYIVSPIV